MKLLITGFEPYHKVKINSTERVLEILQPENFPNVSLIKKILPTRFDEARQEMESSLLELKPDIAISLGMSPYLSHIQVERFAVNLQDSPYPDNNGRIPEEQFIVASGPTAYQVTFSAKKIAKILTDSGIPASVSNTAGTYVCNSVMYSALHTVHSHQLSTLYSFIHIPAVPEEVASREFGATGASMPASFLAQGIQLAIESLQMFKLEV